LTPWPRASTSLDGVRLLIIRTEVPAAGAAPAPPGTVLEASGDRLVVQAGDAPLRILSIQPEGKRALTAREFLAGRSVSVGSPLT
jgi:methionyl-tRNA formyltransferase